MISLFAAACKSWGWIEDDWSISFLPSWGEMAEGWWDEMLVLVTARLSFSPLLPLPVCNVGTMLALSTSWPVLSMSKSVGNSEGWLARWPSSSTSESSNSRMPFKTGFCSKFMRRSRSSCTCEARLLRLLFPSTPLLLFTFCCTLSRRASALLASEKRSNKLNMSIFSFLAQHSNVKSLTSSDRHFVFLAPALTKWAKRLRTKKIKK